MKVLHVISGLRGGGAEHFVLSLCMQSAKDKDIAMSVLTLSAADEISHKFHESGIDLISTSSQKNSKGVNAFKGFRILLKHPDTIFHAHMFHACMIACFAKLLRPSSKIIFTLHNNHISQLHRQLLLFVTRPLRNIDIIFPGMTRKWFQKSEPVVIANGIEISRFNHAHGGKPPLFTCAFVGRLSEEKNPLFLVELAKSLLPEHNFLFRVAGEGPQRRQLEEAVVREKLQGHFNIHGHVDDVSSLLAESHCLLIPSHWEGMPLVLLEAGAAGIPIIATPVGNIPSILNQNNGYIGDVKAFRAMIIDVMDNYGVALIKARRLMHEVAERYSIANIYRQHREIYQSRLA